MFGLARSGGMGGGQLECDKEPVQRRCDISDREHVPGDKDLPENEIGRSQQDMDRSGGDMPGTRRRRAPQQDTDDERQPMRFLNDSILARGARETITSRTSRAARCGTAPSR